MKTYQSQVYHMGFYERFLTVGDYIKLEAHKVSAFLGVSTLVYSVEQKIVRTVVTIGCIISGFSECN